MARLLDLVVSRLVHDLGFGAMLVGRLPSREVKIAVELSQVRPKPSVLIDREKSKDKPKKHLDVTSFPNLCHER